MATIDAATGTVIGDDADIRQSIATIIATPIGTRVMRRPFGSMLFELVDSPATPRGALRLIAAVADAVGRWEPRVMFVSATVVPAADGRATLSVVCRKKDDGTTLATTVTAGAA